MVDRLHLITEIYNRPGLWDLENEQYKTRNGIKELWQEVATSMGPDITVKICKRKWKNLRDAYRAELKRIEIRMNREISKGTYDSKTNYGSKWVYFDHMNFIKDNKKMRRRNDNHDDDDDSALEEVFELHSTDSIKAEPHDVDDSMDSHVYTEKMFNVPENQKHDLTRNLQAIQAIQAIPSRNESNVMPPFLESHKPADNTPIPAIKSDQLHFLQDLEKEEQSLIKSTRLSANRFKDLVHIGDSDYQFLVSFLPQIKRMNELQNLQFRAKLTDLMLTIMSKSLTAMPQIVNL